MMYIRLIVFHTSFLRERYILVPSNLSPKRVLADIAIACCVLKKFGCAVVAGLIGRVVEADCTHVVDGRCKICGNGALGGHIVL